MGSETVVEVNLATTPTTADLDLTNKPILTPINTSFSPSFYVLPILVCLFLTFLVFRKRNQQQQQQEQQKLFQQQQQQLQQQQQQQIVRQLSIKAITPIRDQSDSDKKNVKILFGSQTGTAEDFSRILAEEITSYGYEADVVDLEEYDREQLEFEKFLIFCVATYGDGEPTDNAKEFYDWLIEEDKEPDLLKNLKFTVFGLGNKTYDHFNSVARVFDKRLEELGATRIYRRGEGDDDCSLEEDFNRWKSGLWQVIAPTGSTSKKIESKTDLVLLESLPEEEGKMLRRSGFASVLGYDPKHPVFCLVVENRELHSPESDRSCRHLEIDIGDLTYEPGDHLGVFPENDPSLVEALAQRLGVDLSQSFKLVSNAKSPQKVSSSFGGVGSGPVMGPCTFRTAFTKLLDINSLPRMNALKVLSQYTEDPEEAKELTLLSGDSEEALQKYSSFVKGDIRNFLDILNAFPSCKPPIAHFLELLPRLQPRFYSISSSLKEKPSILSITSVVVEFKTPTGRLNKGVCSSYLASLLPTLETKPKIQIFIRKSTFKLPSDPSVPIVMIGPGTGFAPFRGFLQERKHQKSQNEVGASVLFFGCRRKDHDYLYSEELELFSSLSIINKLYVAFSRESDNKVYVQDLMRQFSDEFWHLTKSGYIYVCGDAKNMAKDVQKTLVELAMKKDSLTEEQAHAFLTKLSSSGRYLQDIWT